jgi:hypothetical protein
VCKIGVTKMLKIFLSIRKIQREISLFLFSILLQLFIFGQHLNNLIINDYDDSKLDAKQYVRYANNWRDYGFEFAFGELQRVPGYPFMINTAFCCCSFCNFNLQNFKENNA